jgi:hypothetical protein
MRIHSMWQALGDFVSAKSFSFIARLAGLGRKQRLALGSLALAGLIGGLWIAPAAATDTSAFFNIGGALGSYVILMISTLVLAVVTLEMVIALLLTKLLIAVATYNDFVGATAVTTGWPLVRDVVNMFFIVVLLIIAFSTIIGYKEFDYKKHVPRLLLMAVLINFSKTLVGLLIDFSQVIMLTFVNGFKEAAFGNFAKAFGLQRILEMSKNTSIESGGENLADSIGLLISLIFGVIMLMVVCTIILIMLIYLVARIIALWIILIFSPMAFFVWALPPKLAKAVSQFSTAWWQQLSAWLSGGPIMAFFLWLTLAIVASSENPFGTLMPNDAEMDFASKLLSRAADTGNLANFVVATALLFFGLKTAVQMSQQASTSLGKLAEGIKKSGGPVGTTFRFAGRTAGKAAGAGARAIDTKYGVTKQFGQGLSKVGAQIGTMGKEGSLLRGIGSMGGMAVQGQAKKFTTMGAERAAGTEKEFGALVSGQPLEQRREAQRAAAGSLDVNTRRASLKDSLMMRFEPAVRNQLMAEEQARLTTQLMAPGKDGRPGKSEEEAKRLAKVQAGVNVDRQTANLMAELEASDDFKNDQEFKDKIDEKRKDNPRLVSTAKGTDALRASIKGKTIGQIPAAAYNNLDAGIETFKAQNLIDSSGRLVNDWQKQVQEMQKINPAQKEALMATGAALQTTAGQNALGINQTGKASNMTLDVGANGAYTLLDADGKIAEEQGGSRQQITNSVIAASNNKLDEKEAAKFASGIREAPTPNQVTAMTAAFSAGAYAPGASSFDADAGRSMAQVQISGIPTATAFGMNSDGSYQSDAYAKAHAETTQSYIANLDSSNDDAREAAAHYVQTIDVNVIKNGGAGAATVVRQMSGNIPKISKAAPDAPVISAVREEAKEASRRIAAGVAKDIDAELVALAKEIAANKTASASARRSTGAREIDFDS